MKSVIIFLLAVVIASSSASVFMPHSAQANSRASRFSSTYASKRDEEKARHDLRLALRQRTDTGAAMAIPGYGVAEQVFVGGFGNFLSIYNIVITGRILLSWFPQAQGIGALQPVYAITDPYLNLFRGVIPPIFGLDLSPLLAFFLLSALQNATAALGAEVPAAGKAGRTTPSVPSIMARPSNALDKMFRNKATRSQIVSMNY